MRGFVPPSDSSSIRGQVGIGTVIVFIAMILVAAIAGSVLINTAGFLQTKSEQTGEMSSDTVTNRLQVSSKVGNVSSSSQFVTVKVYNSSYLKLIGYTGPSYDYTKESLLVKEGDIVYLQDSGGESNTLIYGGESISFTASELTAVTKSNRARVSFEVLDDGEVRLIDETENQAVGVVDPPVTMKPGGDTFLRFGIQFGSEDYQIGNSDTSYPPGSSYVLNETEQQERDGPLNVVETVSITVRNSPGSDPLDLENVTIQYVSSSESARLTYSEGDPTDTTFAATLLKGSGTVLKESEQATIKVNTTIIGDDETSLRPGDSATVLLSTQSGGTTRIRLSVPETLSGETNVHL